MPTTAPLPFRSSASTMLSLVSDVAPLDVSEVTERSAWMSLAGEWDSLVERTAAPVFMRHAFLRIWLDNFSRENPVRVLLARDHVGNLRAALPLMSQRSNLYGMPVLELTSATNPHSCRFDLLAEEPELAGELFWRYLERDDCWDVLRLGDVPEHGNAERLFEAAQARGNPTGTWQSLVSPYFLLQPHEGEDALGIQATSKFRGNLRRRRRKLEARGRVSYERLVGGDDLWESLEEGFALEESGWKGERGTAINKSPETRGFYLELARSFARRGGLSLSFLRLDGRAIAFQFALEEAGTYYLLKPGYDETLGDCSPGQLLMDEVVRDATSRGLRWFDFLGPDMTWKRDWTNAVRVHNWLYVFPRTAFGRALHAAKFRWAPVAKEVVARWKP